MNSDHPTPQVRINRKSARCPGRIASVVRVSALGLVLAVDGQILRYVPASHVDPIGGAR